MDLDLDLPKDPQAPDARSTPVSAADQSPEGDSVITAVGPLASPPGGGGGQRSAMGLGALASTVYKRAAGGLKGVLEGDNRALERPTEAVGAPIRPRNGAQGVLTISPSMAAAGVRVPSADLEGSAGGEGDDPMCPAAGVKGLLSLTSIQGWSEEEASRMCGMLERQLGRLDAQRHDNSPCIMIGF